MADANEVFDRVVAQVRETALLESAAAVLEWDERTGMPKAAGGYRAEQVTTLAGLVHRRRTDPRLGEWLEELAASSLAGDPHDDAGATIRCLRRDFQRACRLPQSLVEATSRATVLGQQRWEAAREADDYGQFDAALEEVLRLRREAGACLAEPGQSTYDALLEDYEEGARAAQLEPMFADLRDSLVPLVAKLGEAPRQPDTDLLRRRYPVDAQRTLSRRAAEAIGYDFRRGRLDETAHPFCTSLGPDDSRILTRYEEHWLPGGLFGTLHEAGHGMYDQGLPTAWYGLPPGESVSLGIHESQSRLWENLVGRDLPFWEFFYDEARRLFPTALGDVAREAFHHAINTVAPSLIRIEADEVTYNLHIIIRFELEQALIAGELSTADLPNAWNEKYERYLGIRPPSDALGVLQDVHWSAGLFGYFPTYTLGNLAASQLFQAFRAAHPDAIDEFRRGDFGTLLGWLRENVHRHGRRLPPPALIRRATGDELNAGPLGEHLTEKYERLYGLK